jgi:HPt (histidine-containing phosphotransfer) domain-containing protein
LSRAPRPTPEDLAALDPDGIFHDRLEADLAAIAELGESADLPRLKRIVHGLAGAAGTFGFGELGDIAIALDDRFVAGQPVSAIDIARLTAALEQALGKPMKSA